MSKIEIAGEEYLIETLPDQSKQILQLMQLCQREIGELGGKMALQQAANAKLSDDLVESVKDVKPLPTPKVEGTKKPAANRRSRRASSSTKKTQK